MTRSSKSQKKKRLLLDEEELKPKTDPWDFFYGKVRSTGAKLSPSYTPLPLTQTDKHLVAPSEDSENVGMIPRQAEAFTRISETPPNNAIGGMSEMRETLLPPQLENLTTRGSQSQSAEVRKLSLKPRINRNSTQPPVVTGPKTFIKGDLESEELTFEDFERAFSKRLTKADLKVCRIIYDQTHTIGQETCILRAEDLAEQVGISRRHLFRVLCELENSGFIKRGGIYNTPTKKGIEITFYPVPRIKKSDFTRQFHYYDADQE